MRFLSLNVENFRCIGKARIEFAPGLNVLHGPNDLGKSTLATAIRAALLLPISSRDTEDFVSWGSNTDAQVQLVFETEPQRIYRVRKTFGHTPKAFLEESRDGVDFQQEAQGRDVDGRLRGLLRWGITPPGGKGAPKGLPISFLSEALLPEQDSVAVIFDRALSDDSDESAKRWLAEVLQAVAEDPLFKKVLGKVQEHVDKAFTESGRKRGGKSSPWTRIADFIKQKEAYSRNCEEEAKKSVDLQTQLEELLERQLARHESLDSAHGILKEIEENYAQTARLKDIVARLEERKRALGEIAKIRKDLEQAENQLNALSTQYTEASQNAQAAQFGLEQAKGQLEDAKQRLLHAKSNDAAQQRELKKAELKNRHAELYANSLRLTAEKQKLEAALHVVKEVREIEQAGALLAKELAKMQRDHESALTTLRDLDHQQNKLTAVGHLLKVRAAEAAVGEAGQKLDQVNAWRKEAAEIRADAESLRTVLLANPGPSHNDIERIKKIATNLQVAHARLEVGLQAKIQVKLPLRVSIQADGAPAGAPALLSAPLDVAAGRALTIDIENVAEISVVGGAKDARDVVTALESRWAAEVMPILAHSNAKDVEELVALALSKAEQTKDMSDKERRASELDQRISDQMGWGASLEKAETELASAKSLLGTDFKAVEDAARQIGVDDPAVIEKRLSGLSAKHQDSYIAEGNLKLEMAKLTARMDENKKSLADVRARLVKAKDGIVGDLDEEVERISKSQGDLELERQSLDAQSALVDKEAGKSVADAESAVADAQQAARLAEQAKNAADEKLKEVHLNRAATEGEMKVRREAFAGTDEAAARNALQEVEKELDLAPKPKQEITEEDVTQARQQVRAATLELDLINDQVKGKKGALEHIGGDVAKQQAEDAAEAVALAHEQEHLLEDECNAWKLLQETLKEAEQEEGVHLGKAIAGPIAQRFGDLTTGRYGRLALGPDLKTQGVAVAGNDHPITALSIGTRDQLALILRLSLAEVLGSPLLLDDQLTQSDREKLTWLRRLLEKVAASTQIIVLTCRPEDYLEENTSNCVRVIKLVDVMGHAQVAKATHLS